MWHPKVEEAWVCLFGDKEPIEVLAMLLEQDYQFSTNQDVADRQWVAWRSLFGYSAGVEDAAKIIGDKFFPQKHFNLEGL